jgi:hypothetical protein
MRDRNRSMRGWVYDQERISLEPFSLRSGMFSWVHFRSDPEFSFVSLIPGIHNP